MLKSFVVLLIASFIAALTASASAPQAQDKKVEKPSILMVMIDDGDFRSWQRMPEVRRLAEEGVVFNNSSTSTSQCCPSRATWLTGQYAHNHEVREQIARFGGGYEKVQETGLEKAALPTWLKEEGYVTFMAGKYMNEYFDHGAPPPGWDRWFAFTEGMANPNLYRVNENGKKAQYDRDRLASVDYLALRGSQFARNTHRYDAPFFMTLQPFTPHKPYFYPERYKNTYNHMEAPKYPSFLEEDKSDKPAVVRNFRSQDPLPASHYDDVYRDRMRGLLGINDMLRDVREELERNGEWDNTIVVFTSDNGYLVGEHGWEGKSVPYEGSIRVPFIAAGPGIPEGETRNHMVLNTDWAPTIADWAGAKPKTKVDGRSMQTIIDDPSAEWRKRFLIEAWGPFQFSAVRREGEMFAYHRNNGGESEYYDLSEDPWQMDGTGKPPHEMKRELQRLNACSGQECRKAEN